MGRIKLFAGAGMLVQALTFLVVLLFDASNKRKRAIIFSFLAATSSLVGAFFVINGIKESVPTLDVECDFGEEDAANDIKCSILAEEACEN